jgi:hypothetical protein
MGIGSSIKKAAKKAGGQIKSGVKKAYHEYDRFTSSKFGATIAPWLSWYDSDGRDAIMKSPWGQYGGAAVGMVNPTAGAAVNAAVGAFQAYNAPQTPAAFGHPAEPIATPATPEEANPVPWRLIGGAVAALAVAGVVVLAVRKGAR